MPLFEVSRAFQSLTAPSFLHAELQCEARRDSIRRAAPSLLAAAPQDKP